MININSKKEKILFIVTSVYMLNFFLIPHLRALSNFFDITLLLKNDAPEILNKITLPIKIIEIPIERKISIIKDITALFWIYKICKQNKFKSVHTLTPKAGLLGMVGAFLSRIPIRIHTFQGEVWSNKTGVIKFLLKNLDRLIVFCSTEILIVSSTERLFLIKENILFNRQSLVLGSGSIGGVDVKKFKINNKIKQELRKKNNFTSEDLVFLYLGRICKDKGLIDLANAYLTLLKKYKKIKLVFIGPTEDNTLENLKKIFLDKFEDKVFFKTFTNEPEKDLLIADVFVLPSYREGFGVSVVEAAALGIPSIGSNIHGIQDAIIDNKTGFLYKVKDQHDLSLKMENFIKYPLLRKEMGLNAKKRVEKEFTQAIILSKFINYYKSLIIS